MKRLILVIICFVTLLRLNAQTDSSIFLLVRGDDIGSSHAANMACIESYRNGIMRSVELMAPGPWFPEAVRLLNENPALDVGVHLVITSEWNGIKWRPLTCCPSLVDKDGYFYATIWQRPNSPKGTALKDAPWRIEEIEKEFRAQIEMARKYVPHISHINCHMGCENCAPQIAALVKKLATEYKLDIHPAAAGFQYVAFWNKDDTTAAQRINSTIKTLKNMQPGRYLFIDHPGIDNAEMRAIWHPGYENVAVDRDAVMKVFTSKEVLKIVQSRNIRLVNYKESVNIY
jgi:predicted glycoside hydrolase/deacetylase ChbG (UPF0249 family)